MSGPSAASATNNNSYNNYNTGSTDKAGHTTLDQLVNTLMCQGSGDDMAFVVFAMQIQKMNQGVTDELKNIQQTSKLRDAMSKDLAKLRDLKALIEKCRNGDDKDRANTGTMIKEHAKNVGCKPEDALESFKKTYPMFETAYSIDKNGSVVKQKVEGSAYLSKGVENGQYAIYTKDVEARIENLGDKMKKLDSNREIKMIMLNQLLNKKGNAVSQLTNMLKQAHNTDQAIINNLK